MKKIILTTSLFFCLSITTILAQVVTTNIAAPDSNGFSNNQVSDFDVNTDGTILNNSASAGTAQLGNTAVTGNSNITTGSEADLILFQVTGSSGSDLNGAIEVFGAEAGLIIANPNGITCDGCGFINTSKVDLVTGTANFSGDDLTGFSIDGSSTLTVSGSGFLSDAVADELKLEAQNISINAQVRANNSLEIIVNNYTQSGAIDVIGDISIQVSVGATLDDNASIQSRNLLLSAYDLYNQADFTITDNATFDIGNDFLNGFYLDGTGYAGGNISAGNFNVTTARYFYNYESATISADRFNVTADEFFNQDSATISADNFNVTVESKRSTFGGFYNRDGATINTNNFNVTTARYFYNYESATISADRFNVTAGHDFENRGTITADNFNVTASRFYNWETISVDSLNISYNSIYNRGIITDGITYYFGNVFIENVNNLHIVPDGASSTDAIQSFSGIDIINIARPDSNGLSNNSYSDFNVLSSGLVFNNSSSAVSSSLAGTIEGNPNYSASDSASLILNQITSNNASYLGGILEVAGDSAAIIIANPSGIVCDACSFANTDKLDLITGTANFDTAGVISDYITTANDVFIYNANIILREFNVTAGNNFFNWGDSTISTDNFHITAEDDFYNRNNATINTNNFNVTAYDFFNQDDATISADNFNVTTEYRFSNYDNATISADNFNVTLTGTHGYFRNQDSAIIHADSFNVTLTGTYGYFRNQDSATITAHNFNVTARSFSNYRSATINTDNFNVTGESFSNYDSATINADNFNVTLVGYGYFFNRNGATINANDFNVTVADIFSNGDGATINADNFNVTEVHLFNNDENSTINADNFNVTEVHLFYNDENSTINAYNFNLTEVDSFSNYATISADNFNLTGGDFRNWDGATINANDFNVTEVYSFSNYATISADNFNLTGGNFRNWDGATINANDFNVTEVYSFSNYATITADSFNVTADSFLNEANSTITANECNIIYTTSYTDQGTITCNDEDEIEVIDIARPDANGLSNNSYTDFNILNSGIVLNNSDSAGTSQLAGSISANTNYNSGDAASLILAQITGNDISLLEGALEVFGAEAGVIIANPSGITCNGCSFINASRVDLVTGSNYNSSTDSFNDIANTNIAIIDDGLDASSVGILNIQAGSFTNTGVLKANTFNLSVIGDFDDTKKGIINATSLNLEVGGDFSNNDASIGFVWKERDTLTVLGNANITALNFINHGSIDITNSFEITAGYTAINQGSIVSEYGSLDITANDFFRNLTGGDIAANTLNIIAGGKVTNTATIDVGTLNITANNNSARTDDRTGFYVSNRGNITATNLNIAAVDNFYNRGNITATNFTTSAKSVFLLNREIDSYDGTYDGGNISLNGDSSFRADGGIIENYGNIISLNGDSSFRADGGSIENYGNIDFGVFNLDITANSFTNHASATIDAATVNLDVASYINDGTVDAVVVSDTTIDQ